jgi:hypothetical protein
MMDICQATINGQSGVSVSHSSLSAYTLANPISGYGSGAIGNAIALTYSHLTSMAIRK